MSIFKSLFTMLACAATAATLTVSSPAHATPLAGSPVMSLLAPELDGQVNLNTANQAQLDLLPGIGPAMAQKIIDYRASKPFTETVQLIRIKGIGRKTFDKLKPLVSIKGDNTLHQVGKSEKPSKDAAPAKKEL